MTDFWENALKTQILTLIPQIKIFFQNFGHVAFFTFTFNFRVKFQKKLMSGLQILCDEWTDKQMGWGTNRVIAMD